MSPDRLSQAVPRPGLWRQAVHHFGHHIRPFWKLLLLGWVCVAIVAGMQLLKPWPLKLVFDAILMPVSGVWIFQSFPQLESEPQLLLALIALSTVAIALLIGIFGFGHNYIFKSVGQRVLAAIRRSLYHHIQRLSHSFYDQNHSGDLLVRLTGDIRTLREVLVSSLASVTERGLFMVGMLLVMLWMDWRLTLVAMLVIPPLALCARAISVRIRKATHRQRGREGELANTFNERLGAIKLVQAFTREAFEDERYSRYEQQNLEAGLEAARLEAHLSRLVGVVLAVGTCAVIWYGVIRVQAGFLSAGDLLVFAAYLKSMNKPVQKIAETTGKLANVSACAERIMHVMEIEPDVRDEVFALPAPKLRGEVRFEKVSFGYGRGDRVLDEVSFTILPGEHVAVVGASGAGKSTLANLLLRFYDPSAGAVRVDGCDIRSYTLGSLRDQIAVVLQEGVLFAGTVRENIAYGRLDASDDEIFEAAEIADAREFVEQLPDGFDTLVGERGKSLSGGQRQRLAIARAVIRNAPILILDEPLTGLDVRSRTLVRAALDRLQAGRSTLHITHDFASTAAADRVLMFDQGRLVAAGSHADLLAENPAYQKLWNMSDAGGEVTTLHRGAA